MGGKLFSVEEKALEDKIYGFFGEEEEDSDQSSDCDWRDDDDESHGQESSRDSNKRTEFWESQKCLLQEILEQCSLIGSKLGQEIAKVIEMARETGLCDCPKLLKSDGCVMCLRRRVVNLLCNRGFNATLFTSKWKHTHKYPGGTHEYIEVMANAAGRKKQVPILIELEFRDEFKMGKACDKYCKIIEQLPEIYIGRPEHLNAIVRAVCDAAKRSTTERNIHMGPWRKRSFMQMKWSASHKRWSLDQSSNKSPLISSRQVHIPSVRSCLQFSAATAVQVA
ncbi:hypothetical protein F0562_035118 [Nyssa sinensis]|uniref:Uncharacterized protein n=1 Tax=Nyssa sinensis TaxID=561372 RepID=A0A5J5AAR7_9ASTE|nr:hypothetical protein F0562_035118 [Nyssa sinensis]